MCFHAWVGLAGTCHPALLHLCTEPLLHPLLLLRCAGYCGADAFTTCPLLQELHWHDLRDTTFAKLDLEGAWGLVLNVKVRGWVGGWVQFCSGWLQGDNSRHETSSATGLPVPLHPLHAPSTSCTPCRGRAW